MGKNRKEPAENEKDKPLDIVKTWIQSLILGLKGANASETETARRLGVHEEEEKEKRDRNRTKEENERDLAP